MTTPQDPNIEQKTKEPTPAQENKLSSRERFARTAMTFVSIVIVVIAGLLFYFNEEPDKTVVLIALFPLLWAGGCSRQQPGPRNSTR